MRAIRGHLVAEVAGHDFDVGHIGRLAIEESPVEAIEVLLHAILRQPLGYGHWLFSLGKSSQVSRARSPVVRLTSSAVRRRAARFDPVGKHSREPRAIQMDWLADAAFRRT